MLLSLLSLLLLCGDPSDIASTSARSPRLRYHRIARAPYQQRLSSTRDAPGAKVIVEIPLVVIVIFSFIIAAVTVANFHGVRSRSFAIFGSAFILLFLDHQRRLIFLLLLLLLLLLFLLFLLPPLLPGFGAAFLAAVAEEQGDEAAAQHHILQAEVACTPNCKGEGGY